MYTLKVICQLNPRSLIMHVKTYSSITFEILFWFYRDKMVSSDQISSTVYIHVDPYKLYC